MSDRLLAVAAHPDDLDFGAAGTIASLTQQGHEVIYCLITNGEAGGFDNTISRPHMAEIRQREQTAAAKVVGVTELHFLGFPDGAVVADLSLRKAITRVIRQVKPDKVITQSPERNWDRIYGSHPDHLATGEATVSAVYPDSRNEFAFPDLLTDEQLEPHTVSELWVMGAPMADHFIDITSTFDAKIEALLCHESQMKDPEGLPDMIREWTARIAAKAGMAKGCLAEGYRIVNTL